MKISEAISKLEEFKDEAGDVELVMLTDVDGRFFVDWERHLDLIEIPENDSENAEFILVCAFLESHLTPDPELRKLKLITPDQSA